MGSVTFRDPAFMANRKVPVHRWVPWIAGFSQQFIVDALGSFTNGHEQVVLDPFAGVGTTLVESDLAGHDSIGFEINPYAAFAAHLKLRAHRVSADKLRIAAENIKEQVVGTGEQSASICTTPPSGFKTRSPFYSPEVERKVLLALDFAASHKDKKIADLVRLAFAATMVDYSNYSYEPSLGRRATVGRSEVDDFPVGQHIADKLEQMAADVQWYRENRKKRQRPDGKVYVQSFFDGYKKVPCNSIDLLITSPPYANNYHYNRNTRPHLYWLEFFNSPAQLKALEEKNFGTYWQRAREKKHISLDDAINDLEIHGTISEIRSKNKDKGIYGGNGWANYVTTYLNDCVRFADGMKWCLRPNATALIVVGNSFVQGVHVPTDRFLAIIAQSRGLELVEIHRPRAARVGNSIINSNVRCSAGKKARLYEAVVELRQP